MIEQFSSMEHDAFHVSYLSDKIPEAVFHGQAVRTVAYLRVSTAQQDVRSQRLAILEYARKHDFRIERKCASMRHRHFSEDVGGCSVAALLNATSKLQWRVQRYETRLVVRTRPPGSGRPHRDRRQ